MKLLLNTPSASRRSGALEAAAPFAAEQTGQIAALWARSPAYATTPLVSLPSLAAELGIGALFVKDERRRLGLGSFKALGGIYAVLTLAARSEEERPGNASLEKQFGGAVRAKDDQVFTTATAGNHGQAVAVGAEIVGAKAVIFVYEGVPEAHVTSIARHGAELVYVRGGYDDAMNACRRRAAAEGWTIVSDMAWDGYEAIPKMIMQGYAVLAHEALMEMGEAPTHIVVQAGVGGLAAAMAGYFETVSDPPPTLLVVEPEAAPCLFESIRAERPIEVPRAASTIMGRLECHRPSTVAFEILSGLAEAFVQVPDEAAEAAAERLAAFGLDTSPSGAAGVAGLLACVEAGGLGLGSDSRVLTLVTEARLGPPIR